MTAPFVPGTPVEIVDGLLKGKPGVVKARAPWNWGGSIPLYDVDVEGVAISRTLRADYLKPRAT